MNTIPTENQFPFPFFPIPAERETVYSAFCRFIKRFGIPPTCILQELTGGINIQPFLSVLPGYLTRLSLKVPPGHPWSDPEQIVRDHTALPYLIYFTSSEEKTRLYMELAQAESTINLSARLGLTRHLSHSAPPHPQYCPTCVLEDKARLGFSFFKLEHQLPGVALCWKHGKPLSQGCVLCGPYPIPRNKFCLPGRCNCPEGAKLLSAQVDPPADAEPLLWLAHQAAFLLNSNGPGTENIRGTLRKFALERGFGQKSLLSHRRLAEAIEGRFGEPVLKFLGVPVWKEGRPAPWISRIFAPTLEGKKKSPTILFLLIIGVLFESVATFEKTAIEPIKSNIISYNCPNADSRQIPQAKAKKTADINFEKELYGLLNNNLRLTSIARRLNLSISNLTEELFRLGLRVPLSIKIITKYGNKTIKAIKNDLRNGKQKSDIYRKYRCDQMTLLEIQLDEPRLHQVHENERQHFSVKKHRKILVDYLLANQNSSRTAIFNDIPVTYNYLLKNDKNWLYSKVPAPKSKKKENRPQFIKDWATIDHEKSKELNLIIDELIEANQDSLWISKTATLNRVGLVRAFNAYPDRFPLVSEVLDQRLEPREAFIIRRIKWAINQILANDERVSLNRISIISNLHHQTLIKYKKIIVEYINSKSQCLN